VRMAREDFARFDRDAQTILLRREGAGGIVCEGAGQVIGFVEVHKELLALLVRIRVVVPAGGVGDIFVG